VATTLIVSIPEETKKPPLREAVASLHKKLDPIGFVIFAATTTTFLLGITWGGSKFEWSSATIIGLLCGSVGLTIAFALWTAQAGNDALIPLPCLYRQPVVVGSVVMFLQGGATQMIPYFLPLWFQAIHGDSPVISAVHMLSSLVSQIVSLVAFGALGECMPSLCRSIHSPTLLRVQKLHYGPPWAIFGSVLSGIGSKLLTTLSLTTTSAEWIGYQIITAVGRGMAFQVAWHAFISPRGS
jgi:hypothetical protein